MNANQRAKFDVLNAHIVNTVVFAGELVIVGDPGTSSCTSHEAFLMAKAVGIHRDIVFNDGGVDGFLLENFEMLQSLLAHASMGAGAASDGWARHLEAIKKTMEQIEKVHREHMSGGVFRGREEFYAKRSALFMQLGSQLDKVAAYGSGLRNHGSIKRMLQLSTKRYLNSGEISDYAQKVSATATVICSVVFEVPSGGTGALLCAVVGGVAGGEVGGDKGKRSGEWLGEVIYENIQP